MFQIHKVKIELTHNKIGGIGLKLSNIRTSWFQVN